MTMRSTSGPHRRSPAAAQLNGINKLQQASERRRLEGLDDTFTQREKQGPSSESAGRADGADIRRAVVEVWRAKLRAFEANVQRYVGIQGSMVGLVVGSEQGAVESRDVLVGR